MLQDTKSFCDLYRENTTLKDYKMFVSSEFTNAAEKYKRFP